MPIKSKSKQEQLDLDCVMLEIGQREHPEQSKNATNCGTLKYLRLQTTEQGFIVLFQC